jgi:hypothetical protein
MEDLFALQERQRHSPEVLGAAGITISARLNCAVKANTLRGFS